MKKRLLAIFCALFLLAGAVPSADALEGEAAVRRIRWRR